MKQVKKAKVYISELDSFIHKFNNSRTKLPDSIIKEQEKHKVIFEKRDHPINAASDPRKEE
jgi:hypothetical protein